MLLETKTEDYLGYKIIASMFEFKIDQKFIKNYTCTIYKDEKFFINLGECNNGSKFTAINQCINQAKSFLNSLKKLNKI
jgi:hypothetical protein